MEEGSNDFLTCANTLNLFNPLQKAIKEKEFELIMNKNQKLENLCRALQGERKGLYEKVQGAAGQADVNTAAANVKEVPEVKEVPMVKETPKEAEDNHPVQNTEAPATAAPTGTPTIPTLKTMQLEILKAEQARLKEVASSFTISHIIPTETVASQSQGHCEGVQEPEQSHGDESGGDQLQAGEQEGEQEQRDLEMESVD